MAWNVEQIRQQFPALQRTVNGQPAVFLDGPAGSQVPESVAAAVSHYLLHTNANRGAPFATARESDDLLNSAHQVLADFLGTDDPDTVCFGANMTTITLQVSRALSQQWEPGDEIILSRLDHDANFTPWRLAAEERGVRIRYIDLREDDFTLNLDDFESKLSERTRLVAVGYAANSTGTINPVSHIVDAAHRAGALVYVDAVHLAPHRRLNVSQLNCDFLVCSAYKFFGPHVGILWGRRQLLEDVRPYKLRPAPEALPGRWMTGTQNHEGIAGAAAAVEYMASLDDGGSVADTDNNASADNSRSAKLDRVYSRIKDYELLLSRHLIEQLQQIPGLTVQGITDPEQLTERVPTVSVTAHNRTPREMAAHLAQQGIFVWSGNHYALPFTEAAGLEPEGTLRIGALHYNTVEELNRVATSLKALLD
jgi:cysteine desulfurase family protein (TIGR01976 family)